MLATAICGEKPKRNEIGRLIPYIGYQSESEFKLPSGGRLIKTHEPHRREYRKAIYIVRDWREVCVSYYYFERRHARCDEKFASFLKKFQEGKVDGFGKWTDHVNSWLKENQNNQKILFVKYEYLVENTRQVLNDALKFVGVTPCLDLGDVIKEHSREKMVKDEDSSMAKNSSIPFVRSKYAGQNLEEFFLKSKGERVDEEFMRLNQYLNYS
ncbi:hypothetical protein FHR94_000662 [Halomonas cerina]|uniref:Sulfotransferase domain-containing protein n=1 Tax=Halomonas cerina TaxID=447424 RepID=A0A839V626_9GAMM|nr:hypothetical protein [Halomonas cerina]